MQVGGSTVLIEHLQGDIRAPAAGVAGRGCAGTGVVKRKPHFERRTIRHVANHDGQSGARCQGPLRCLDLQIINSIRAEARRRSQRGRISKGNRARSAGLAPGRRHGRRGI